MFLRSKYKDNYLANVHHSVIREVKPLAGFISIIFHYFQGDPIKWNYETKEQRNDEYNWILSQLDCRVNEEREKLIFPLERFAYCQCGGKPVDVKTENEFIVECDSCNFKARAKELKKARQIWYDENYSTAGINRTI